MIRATYTTIFIAVAVMLNPAPVDGQTTPYSDPSNGLRPVQASGIPSTSAAPVMVPLNSPGGMGFDPYGRPSSTPIGGGGIFPPSLQVPVPSLPPAPSTGSFPQAYSGYQPSGFGAPTPMGPAYSTPGSLGPTYTGPAPILPGAGQSAIVNTNPTIPYQPTTPGLYPSSTPSALFPGSYGTVGSYGTTGGSGSYFGDWFNGWGSNPNNGYGGTYGAAPGAFAAPNSYWPNSQAAWNGNAWNQQWNPQGAVFGGQPGQSQQFIRLCQGARFRHAYIPGNSSRTNSLGINDTDLSLALLFPNFAWSTQPLYLLPTFSLHQWHGPFPYLDPVNNTADLPSKAFSAFLDAGWQSDPATIFGAELGVRVGVFSEFGAVSSRSVRVMGRGIGRVRLTPHVTGKLGVLYLDRNRVGVLPAGGILWQPNPGTRLDLFFPEPKLSSYMTTLGNVDTWWYVAGYYGGGNWTVERELDGSQDSVDINDIRVVIGLEWGRNDMMRDGRRIGFVEAGYVFDRELVYRDRPQDNLDLQDQFVIRIGFGY